MYLEPTLDREDRDHASRRTEPSHKGYRPEEEKEFPGNNFTSSPILLDGLNLDQIQVSAVLRRARG